MPTEKRTRPADGHVTHRDDDGDYEITFHPAFASSCVLNTNGRDRTLYEQSEVCHLPGGKLPRQHTIHLRSKDGTRDIRLRVDDPRHAVARITVELYPEEHDPLVLEKRMTTTSATFTVLNSADTCPPHCTKTPTGPLG